MAALSKAPIGANAIMAPSPLPGPGLIGLLGQLLGGNADAGAFSDAIPPSTPNPDYGPGDLTAPPEPTPTDISADNPYGGGETSTAPAPTDWGGSEIGTSPESYGGGGGGETSTSNDGGAESGAGGVSGYLAGGPIPSDRDAVMEPVPATLHEGEYVLRPEAVRMYGRGLLGRINRGQIDPKKLRGLLGRKR
jgi:hypothetical protein